MKEKKEAPFFDNALTTFGKCAIPLIMGITELLMPTAALSSPGIDEIPQVTPATRQNIHEAIIDAKTDAKINQLTEVGKKQLENFGQLIEYLKNDIKIKLLENKDYKYFLIQYNKNRNTEKGEEILNSLATIIDEITNQCYNDWFDNNHEVIQAGLRIMLSEEQLTVVPPPGDENSRLESRERISFIISSLIRFKNFEVTLGELQRFNIPNIDDYNMATIGFREIAEAVGGFTINSKLAEIIDQALT